jgi:hypothetical protein
MLRPGCIASSAAPFSFAPLRPVLFPLLRLIIQTRPRDKIAVSEGLEDLLGER